MFYLNMMDYLMSSLLLSNTFLDSEVGRLVSPCYMLHLQAFTHIYMHIYTYCQAPSQIPNPQSPAPTQSNPVKISSKGTGAVRSGGVKMSLSYCEIIT